MKKVLYLILLAIEAYLAVCCILLMFSWEMPLVPIATALVLAVLLTLLIRRLKRQKKAEDAAGARKTRIWIALALLLPVIPAAVVLVEVALALALYG